MSWNGHQEGSDRLLERGFDLSVDGRRIPGLYWRPAQDPGRGLVLLGHGATNDKRAEYVVGAARALVDKGMAAVAIDGPGHGDRHVDATGDLYQQFEQRWHGGGGTDGVVADWAATLDFIEEEDGARPTGWFGLSMGTMMGLPLAANDGRIRAAVLGLMGTWGPSRDDLLRLAPEVRCPVRFLIQWDDELIPRQASLDLFDRLGTDRKSLHAYPGTHSEVPIAEGLASLDYLENKLR